MTTTRGAPRLDEITRCRKCAVEIMFLQSVNRSTGKLGRMPVNVRPTHQRYRAPHTGEVSYVHGEHEPHWATCPDADSFRVGRAA
jgi:hypothetical protein